MIIAHRREEDFDVVEISGRLLMADEREARQSLKSIIEEGVGKLILDLSQLSFIDSSGCAVLISSLKAIRARQGRIALCTLTHNVRTLLELTLVIKLFDVYDTPEAAMADFRANPSKTSPFSAKPV